MKQFLLNIFCLFAFFTISYGQCNLIVSDNEVCAGEDVGVYFANTSNNFTYRVMVSSPVQSGPINGDSITFTPPGTGQDYVVTFIPQRRANLGNFAPCGNPVSITVLASPDASIDFITGSNGPDGEITNCDASIGNPEFELVIGNASSTQSTNTNYVINWGDGTAPLSVTSFDTLSHIYQIGSFQLTVSVEGQGNPLCSPSSTSYTIFNGTSPSVGLVDLLNIAGPEHGCPPIYSEFEIIEIDSNVVGTMYDVIIDGDTIVTFPHPPPPTFEYIFEETSCGHNATFPNTYEVRIEARNPCLSVPDFATLGPIIIGDSVQPDFTYNPDPVCINEVITFTNTTLGAINGTSCGPIIDAAWSIEPTTGWQLVSGNLDASYQIQVLFDDPGNYEVTIEAGNSCDTLEETKEILVSELPFADAIATMDSPNGCAPGIATFQNLSTNDTSVTYNWSVFPSGGVSFINGTNNNSFEPEIQFSNQGNFQVTLTVSNACGSPTWDTTLSILDQVQFNLEEVGNICADTFIYNEDVSFSFPGDSIVWTFNGGEPSSFVGENPPPVLFIGSGDYSIQIDAHSICGVNSQIESFNVSEPVVVDAGDDFSICSNEEAILLNGTPTGGMWFGNGVNGDIFDPSLVSSNSEDLIYTFDNGICFFTDTLTVSIIRIEDLTAGPDQAVCINALPIELIGNNPTGGQWIGNAVTTDGFFNPELGVIGNNEVGYVYNEPILGCADTVYKNVTIVDIPEIIFDLPDSNCVNDTIEFELNIASAAIVTWDFGNGDILTGNPVQFAYTGTGNFTITASVDLNNCSTSNQSEITIIETPNAGFTIDEPIQCNTAVINFSNTSIGIIDSVYWDFGNGLTSTNFNPLGIVFNPGVYNDTTYIVELTVGNSCGISTYQDTIFVLKEPVALFGTDYQSYCQDQPVIINNVSYNSPTSFYWDFGNGETSTDQNPPNQIYPTSEDDTIYVITLIASNSCGSDTIQNEITIQSVDVVSFFNTSDDEGCAPFEVDFISFSSVGASLIWDFGDGNTSNLDTVTHIFQSPGVYNVQLAVDNGCSKDTSTIEINVLEGPGMAFEIPDVVCQYEVFDIVNNTAGSAAYFWEFGDGDSSILFQPTHAYQNAGIYNITMNAISNYYLECENSLTKSIEVKPAPIADFSAETNTVCSGTAIQFNNLSNADNFYWDFGDGNVSYVENPTNTYLTARAFDVTLVVNNDNFCYDTIVRPGIVEVFGIPVADFTYSQSPSQIPYGEVSFENLSNAEATSFLWDFGDGDIQSILENPEHVYIQSGQHFVTLEATSDFGCVDTIVKPIGVEFFGKLFVPNAMSPVLGSQTEASIFLPKGVGLIEYELEVYSTYGELLFRTTELSEGQPVEGWDGTFNGKPMPQDNYVWKIIAMFDNGLLWPGIETSPEKFSTLGTLVLIR